jgi:hypothetical protein
MSLTPGLQWQSVVNGKNSSGQNIFVAVAVNTTGTVSSATSAYSTDGINWTLINAGTPGALPLGAWYGLAFGAPSSIGYFVATQGTNGGPTGSKNPYAYSTDGITWIMPAVTSSTPPAVSGTANWQSICYNPNIQKFMIAGYSQSRTYWTSDLSTWTSISVPTSIVGPQQNYTGITFANNGFLLYGTGANYLILYLQDTSSQWQGCAIQGLSPMFGARWVRNIIFVPRYFTLNGSFVDAYIGVLDGGQIIVSLDAITWNYVLSKGLNSIMFNPNASKPFAGLGASNIYNTTLQPALIPATTTVPANFSSSPVWTPALGNENTIVNWTSVTSGQNLYVAVGFTSSPPPSSVTTCSTYSLDGIYWGPWTPQNCALPTPVTYGPCTNATTCGQSGTQSTGAITITQLPTPTPTGTSSTNYPPGASCAAAITTYNSSHSGITASLSAGGTTVTYAQTCPAVSCPGTMSITVVSATHNGISVNIDFSTVYPTSTPAFSVVIFDGITTFPAVPVSQAATNNIPLTTQYTSGNPITLTATLYEAGVAISPAITATVQTVIAPVISGTGTYGGVQWTVGTAGQGTVKVYPGDPATTTALVSTVLSSATLSYKYVETNLPSTSASTAYATITVGSVTSQPVSAQATALPLPNLTITSTQDYNQIVWTISTAAKGTISFYKATASGQTTGGTLLGTQTTTGAGTYSYTQTNVTGVQYVYASITDGITTLSTTAQATPLSLSGPTFTGTSNFGSITWTVSSAVNGTVRIYASSAATPTSTSGTLLASGSLVAGTFYYTENLTTNLDQLTYASATLTAASDSVVSAPVSASATGYSNPRITGTSNFNGIDWTVNSATAGTFHVYSATPVSAANLIGTSSTIGRSYQVSETINPALTSPTPFIGYVTLTIGNVTSPVVASSSVQAYPLPTFIGSSNYGQIIWTVNSNPGGTINIYSTSPTPSSVALGTSSPSSTSYSFTETVANTNTQTRYATVTIGGVTSPVLSAQSVTQAASAPTITYTTGPAQINWTVGSTLSGRLALGGASTYSGTIAAGATYTFTQYTNTSSTLTATVTVNSSTSPPASVTANPDPVTPPTISYTQGSAQIYWTVSSALAGSLHVYGDSGSNIDYTGAITAAGTYTITQTTNASSNLFATVTISPTQSTSFTSAIATLLATPGASQDCIVPTPGAFTGCFVTDNDICNSTGYSVSRSIPITTFSTLGGTDCATAVTNYNGGSITAILDPGGTTVTFHQPCTNFACPGTMNLTASNISTSSVDITVSFATTAPDPPAPAFYLVDFYLNTAYLGSFEVDSTTSTKGTLTGLSLVAGSNITLDAELMVQESPTTVVDVGISGTVQVQVPRNCSFPPENISDYSACVSSTCTNDTPDCTVPQTVKYSGEFVASAYGGSCNLPANATTSGTDITYTKNCTGCITVQTATSTSITFSVPCNVGDTILVQKGIEPSLQQVYNETATTSPALIKNDNLIAGTCHEYYFTVGNNLPTKASGSTLAEEPPAPSAPQPPPFCWAQLIFFILLIYIIYRSR